MSLIKSFNKNFLKQNIKKSKGPIIFSIFVVPFLTALLLFSSNSSSSTVIFSWAEASIVNIFIMYIIPFIFSKMLFGFVFNKNSTDFINSMPINRKTIFITNTIGGILLITIIQLLTGAILFAGNLISDNLLILPKVIFDSIILMWVSYIFIFTASNLAMTFSSTFRMHFITTVIILFLVPFTIDSFGWMNSIEEQYNDSNIVITDGFEELPIYTIDHINNYTMPYKVIRYSAYIEDIYSEASLARMSILSVLYIIIGLKLFKIRKMEDNEGATFSLKKHLIIKALTLLPILLIVNIITSGSTGNSLFYIIVFSLITIYYFVYDFVNKRRVPLLISIFSLVGIVIGLQIGISGIEAISSIASKEIKLSDIKSVSIGKKDGVKYSYFGYNDLKDIILDGNYFIKDEELIRTIFENSESKDVRRYGYTNYNSEEQSYLNVNFKTKFGKVYSTKLCMSNKAYKNILDFLENDEDYNDYIKDKIISKGAILINNKVVDSTLYSKLSKELKNAIDEIDLKEINSNEYMYTFSKSSYINHDMKSYSIPVDITEKMLEIVSEYKNKEAAKVLKNINGKNIINGYNNINIYNSNGINYIHDSEQEVLEFLTNNLNDKFDSSKKFVVIVTRFYLNGKTREVVFFTNKVTEVNNIIKEDNTESIYNDYDYEYDYIY